MYSLYPGSTQSLAFVLQPSEAPDPSAQTESEPHCSQSAVMESPPPPYYEQGGSLEYLAHERDMVWSSGLSQIPLEVHLKGEDFSAMI